jgi:hypothetical protein
VLSFICFGGFIGKFGHEHSVNVITCMHECKDYALFTVTETIFISSKKKKTARIATSCFVEQISCTQIVTHQIHFSFLQAKLTTQSAGF